MQYIGKIVGFILGYQIFHSFFGALLGAFLGHLADKKIYELGSVSSSVFGSGLTRQSIFTQTTFAATAIMKNRAKKHATPNPHLRFRNSHSAIGKL